MAQYRLSSRFITIRRPIWQRTLQRRGTFPCRKEFHSYEHPATRPLLDCPPKKAILAAAYAQVPHHGFTQNALIAGARDVGYLDISPCFLADSSFELIRYHLVTRRQEMSWRDNDGRHGIQENAVTVDHKVETLVWQRLMENHAIIRHWPQALAVMAHPRYALTSVSELAALVDIICHLAGDGASEQSWYTKRAGLSVIYSSAELFMTTDTSLCFKDTRSFLNRRLHEANIMNDFVTGLRGWVSYTLAAGANIIRSTGQRI